MTMTRRDVMILMAGTAATLSAAPAFAAADHTVVEVELWDKGLDAANAFDDSKPIMMATPGEALMASAPMGVKVDKKKVPAGEVQFHAVNTSDFTQHEMIVVPIADVTKALPYDADTARFDEDAAGAIGEIPETDPGAEGTASFHLDPGTYMLACNIAGHYAMGMWTLITVE